MTRYVVFNVPSAHVERMTREMPTAATANVRESVAQIGSQFLRTFLQERFRNYDGKKGEKVASRTTALKRSFGVQQNADGSVSIGSSGVLYAGIQETGGTIKPKKGKFLTIPLKAAQQPNGATRGQAKLVKKGGAWHTDGRVPGATDTATFIRRSGKGTPIIYVQGRKGEPLPLYALVKSSKIPARLGFMRTWQQQEPTREKQYVVALDRVGRAFVQSLSGGSKP